MLVNIRIHILAFFLFLPLCVVAQKGIVKGKVKDPDNKAINNVKIQVLNSSISPVYSDANGDFRIKLDPGSYVLEFTTVGYDTTRASTRVATSGSVVDLPVKMLPFSLDEQEIIGEKDITELPEGFQTDILPVKPEDILKTPATFSVEQVMASVAGGTSSEFSSQYRIRGGNYDENLIYVNGIEIYRPFLPRAGQQEGLGFTNPYLADDLKFSTGGFEANYGDKMSSVLDITYRTPKKFRGTAEVGILTTNLHVEGTSKNRAEPEEPGRFTYLLGARRFSSTYVLNSLDVQGSYRPNFLDLQTMLTYTPKRKSEKYFKIRTKKNGEMDTTYIPNNKLKLTTFWTFARNRYIFRPENRETTFGTIQQAFNLFVAFEGQERMGYTTGLGAFMIEHRPNVRLKLDYILTGFRTEESELFTVEGGYRLSDINTNFGSDEFGESTFVRGIGTEFNYGRNYLTANVGSAQIKGTWAANKKASHKLHWGVKYQYQRIKDDLKEYILIDSAGYVVDSTGGFGREEYIRGSADLTSNTFKAYFMHEWALSPSSKLLTGVRGMYYDLTDDWLVAPRIQFVYDASKREKKKPKEYRLRLAGGMYHQPPFYREFRRLNGTLNLGIKPQTAVHALAGVDYRFNIWNRPFRLSAEGYYKYLYNLIPYEIQNVRVRYYPDRVAKGYAYGFDARLNGEFIKGVDSWVSFGILNTREDVLGDTIGYIPRPTDQRFHISFFFQDEMPINPTYKVHIKYVYGSGTRFGPPRVFENRTAFGFPAYHRVDIGFSKLISFKVKTEGARRPIESIWASVEVFNLFQRANTVSYTWVKDIFNTQFAVPNFLSARLLNARVIVTF